MAGRLESAAIYGNFWAYLNFQLCFSQSSGNKGTWDLVSTVVQNFLFDMLLVSCLRRAWWLRTIQMNICNLILFRKTAVNFNQFYFRVWVIHQGNCRACQEVLLVLKLPLLRNINISQLSNGLWWESGQKKSTVKGIHHKVSHKR